MTTTKDKTLIGTMEDKAKLQTLVDKIDNSTYYLHYGEYERPDLKVRKIRGQNAYGIYVNWYFNLGTYGAKEDGWLDVYSLYELIDDSFSENYEL